MPRTARVNLTLDQLNKLGKGELMINIPPDTSKLIIRLDPKEQSLKLMMDLLSSIGIHL